MLKQSRNWFETFKSNQLLQLTNPSKASTKCSSLPIAYQLSQNTVSHFVTADLIKLCIWSVQNVSEFCHQIHSAQIPCRKLVGENPNHDFAQGDLSGHSSCKLNLWHYEILALMISCNSETWKARCVLTQGWTGFGCWKKMLSPRGQIPLLAPPLWTCCYMQLRFSNNSETITTVRNLSGLLQTLSYPSNNCTKKKKKKKP
jgi:hypothetical protein